jgi:hypothetical protein
MYGSAKAAESTLNRALVVSTASFTRDDYEEMKLTRRVYTLFENFGALRHVARYVRAETGIREVDLFERIRVDARADAERWPFLAFATRAVPDFMAPPVSWRLFYDEVRAYVVEQLGVLDDGALDTVMEVQHGLMPARGRTFPVQLHLPHDYADWYARMVALKDEGHRTDWPEHLPALRDLPPAPFEIDDPDRISEAGLGFRFDIDQYGNWEMRSPVMRHMSGLRIAAG